MTVHNTLGSGFREVIYQRALAIEMEKQGMGFARETEMMIYYDGIEIGTRRVDFFVEDKIMVELKAVSSLDDLHLAQAMNYLEAYKLPVCSLTLGARLWNSKGCLIRNIPTMPITGAIKILPELRLVRF